MRLALALITVLCVAACGASGSSGGTGTSAKADFGQFLLFSKCMRSHGVPNFPDPSSRGGIQFTPGSGLNPQSPAFQAAQKVCRPKLPGGGPGAIKATKAQFAAALRFAKCMRTHGLPNFPDPISSVPAGGGPIISVHGMMFRPGQGISPLEPAFRQAAARCGVSLPKPPVEAGP
jgi:hypothetical protein